MGSGIVVNVSKKESEAKSFEDLPAGKYHMVISDVELAESQSDKNFGKPMYKVEFTIQETGNPDHDKYFGQKAWTNACLWSGALYTIINIMKALGMEVDEGDLEIPDVDELVGKELIVRMAKTPERTVTDKNGEKKTYDARMEPKGFFPLSSGVKVPKAGSAAATGKASSNGTSILP